MKKIFFVLLLSWINIFTSYALNPTNYFGQDFIIHHLIKDNDSSGSGLDTSDYIPSDILNLYPLAIGNKWIYLEKYGVNPFIWYEVITKEVLNDSLAANGKLYYHILQDDNHYLERVDSINGKAYRFYIHPNLPELEYLFADLMGQVGDSMATFDPNHPNYYSYIKIIQVETINKWGLFSVRKTYQQITFDAMHYMRFTFTENIGIESSISGYPTGGYGTEWTLKGCVINGIVYGDTATVVDVIEEQNLIVNDFKLYQNYPNPFNPTTKISWVAPVSSWQTLKVYDVLGNEVATLVDEYRSAGSYEIEFNPASSIKHLPAGRQGPASGIYFYQLQAGDFVETQKMILLK